jgi:hypothetical protein
LHIAFRVALGLVLVVSFLVAAGVFQRSALRRAQQETMRAGRMIVAAGASSRDDTTNRIQPLIDRLHADAVPIAHPTAARRGGRPAPCVDRSSGCPRSPVSGDRHGVASRAPATSIEALYSRRFIRGQSRQLDPDCPDVTRLSHAERFQRVAKPKCSPVASILLA